MIGSLVSDIAINVLVIIAVLSFIGAQVAQWRATKNSEAQQQVTQDQLDTCRGRVQELEAKNLELMERLLKANGH